MGLAELTLDAWVTSDQHWEHNNIRRYQNRPYGHFWIMRNRWFSTVGMEDVVLHLGDLVCFGDRERHPAWIEGLPGQKLLIRGNHDMHTDQWYEDAGFHVLTLGRHLWRAPDGRVILFSHEPDTERLDWDVNVHGHIHANPYWEGTPMRDYRNVSVEVTGYAPVCVRDVLAGAWAARRLLHS